MNKLVDQYINTSHHCIGKKRINADYSALNEKIETNHNAPKFKANDRVRITKYRITKYIFLVKVTLKIGPQKYLLPILF